MTARIHHLPHRIPPFTVVGFRSHRADPVSTADEHLLAIFEPLDLYGGARPEAYRDDVRGGLGEAIADFVCDARFLAGFYCGTIILSALALVAVTL